MMKKGDQEMKKFAMVAVALLFALGMISCDQGGTPAESSGTPAAPPGTEAVTLTVTGMDCPHGCAPRVQKALAGVPGVRMVKVDYGKKEAVLTVEKGKFDPRAARDALQAEDAKFNCEPKS